MAEKGQAQWRLLLPRDPGESDSLYLAISYGEMRLGLIFSDADPTTATALLDLARSLLPRCHVEYQAHKGTGEIDSDLNQLFGEGDDDA